MSRSDTILILLYELEEVTAFLCHHTSGNEKTASQIEHSQAVIDRHRIKYPKREA